MQFTAQALNILLHPPRPLLCCLPLRRCLLQSRSLLLKRFAQCHDLNRIMLWIWNPLAASTVRPAPE